MSIYGRRATAFASRSRNWLFHPEPRANTHQPVRPTSMCSTSYKGPSRPLPGHCICSDWVGAQRIPSRRCLCA